MHLPIRTLHACLAIVAASTGLDAQVSYTLEQFGLSATANCAPSPLFPTGGPQATGPIALNGPGFALATTDGCSGGITIAEAAGNTKVYWTDGTRVFCDLHPLYLPSAPNTFGTGITPPVPFGGIAVNEQATQLYLVAGQTLYSFNLILGGPPAITNLATFIGEVAGSQCLTGLDLDKCTGTLFATTVNGIVFNFTTNGLPVNSGLFVNLSASLTGATITGLAIDDSATFGNALQTCAAATSTCQGVQPPGLYLLAARSNTALNDATLLGVNAAGLTGFTQNANESTPLPCGLTLVADAQHAPGNVDGTTSTSPSVVLNWPVTQNNLLFGALTLTYTASSPLQQMTIAGQVGCLPAPITTPNGIFYLPGAPFVTSPGPTYTVSLALTPPVGTDITSQAGEYPSPVQLSDGINIRYSR